MEYENPWETAINFTSSTNTLEIITPLSAWEVVIKKIEE